MSGCLNFRWDGSKHAADDMLKDDAYQGRKAKQSSRYDRGLTLSLHSGSASIHCNPMR